MKDDKLDSRELIVLDKKIRRIHTQISLPYWFGWTGHYATDEKKQP